MGKRNLTTAQIAMIMAGLTVFSKLLSFVRELVLANYYGAGIVTDAYVMASQIPGTLLAAVMTACGTAYMPIFSEKFEKEGEGSADLFTSRILNFLFILNGAVIILGALFARPLVSFFAPGYSGEVADLTVYYLRIAFLLLLGNVVISIFRPYLQYRGHLLASIVIGLLQSASIIIFIVISAYTSHYLLIWGVVIGYASYGLLMWLFGSRSGFSYTADFRFSGAVKETFLLALPVFIGGGVSQINTFVDKMLASGFGEGSVSALNYGHLIQTFILTLSASIMVTILYPKLNKAFATDDHEKIGYVTESAINLMALICIPFTLGSMVYAAQVIQAVYERGAFSGTATELTTIAFFWYSACLFFMAINELLTKVFYSMHDTKTAVYCSVIAVITNIVLNVVLSRFMGIGGLALATSIAQFVNSSALYLTFKHKYPHIRLLKGKRKLILVCVFSMIAVGLSYVLYSALSMHAGLPQIIDLGAAVLAAGIIYLVLLYIAKFDELNLIKDLVKR